MIEQDTVAILLSTYNGEKYICDQLDSLLKQDYSGKYMVWIRDDGSVDGTLALIEEYGSKHENVEVIRGENIGMIGSFCELMKLAVERGFDYYAFCDQDDVWLSDKLRAAISVLRCEDGEQPLLYGSCSYLADESLCPKGGTTQVQRRPITFFNTAIQNFCPGHSQVLNHALAKQVVEKTTSLEGIFSWDLWIANAAAVIGKVVFDRTPHTLYRQHTENQQHYGVSAISWVRSRLHRLLRKHEGRKFSTQLAAFSAVFRNELSEEQRREVERFFDAQSSFFSRFGYACTTKLYRQKRRETLMFRVLYTFGAYRPNKKFASPQK